MKTELETTHPQPRMAAFKTDLFDEIDELKDQLDTAKTQKTFSMALNLILFIILLLASSLTAHADVYKCRAANGDMTYQQNQCRESMTKQNLVLKKFKLF